MPVYKIDYTKTQQKTVTEKTAQNPVVSFISNCFWQERTTYFTELNKYIPIDNYGKCLKNAEVPEELKLSYYETTKIKVLEQYKFYLAFENSNLTDYVTEKLLHGFMATTLPIYMGAPNINDFLPHNHSVIKTSDFQSPQHLAAHIQYLLQNKTAYDEYFLWRQLPPTDIQVPKSMRPRSCPYCDKSWYCRICLRLHGII